MIYHSSWLSFVANSFHFCHLIFVIFFLHIHPYRWYPLLALFFLLANFKNLSTKYILTIQKMMKKRGGGLSFNVKYINTFSWNPLQKLIAEPKVLNAGLFWRVFYTNVTIKHTISKHKSADWNKNQVFIQVDLDRKRFSVRKKVFGSWF